MTKLRKQKRRQRYQFNRNRKRMNKNFLSTGKVKDSTNIWEENKSVVRNVNELGLSLNPNKTIKMPNTKQERLKLAKAAKEFLEEDINPSEMGTTKQEEKLPRTRPRAFIIEKLEEEIKTFRPSNLKLPKGVVSQLSYFLDKYQLNYKAMVRDRKNYDQLTWRQFRSKIRKFMAIEEQFNQYLESRNLDGNNLNWKECTSDDDDIA